MSKMLELKAYQILYQLKEKMLLRIQQEARNKTEYCQNEPEKALEWIGYIANPAKWDYCGLLSKEDKRVLETIEYLLNDDLTEVREYREWKPMNL